MEISAAVDTAVPAGTARRGHRSKSSSDHGCGSADGARMDTEISAAADTLSRHNSTSSTRRHSQERAQVQMQEKMRTQASVHQQTHDWAHAQKQQSRPGTAEGARRRRHQSSSGHNSTRSTRPQARALTVQQRAQAWAQASVPEVTAHEAQAQMQKHQRSRVQHSRGLKTGRGHQRSSGRSSAISTSRHSMGHGGSKSISGHGYSSSEGARLSAGISAAAGTTVPAGTGGGTDAEASAVMDIRSHH